ncbi:MAG: hypothetical protein AB7K09_07665 [Planctomycetota bacterium]
MSTRTDAAEQYTRLLERLQTGRRTRIDDWQEFLHPHLLPFDQGWPRPASESIDAWIDLVFNRLPRRLQLVAESIAVEMVLRAYEDLVSAIRQPPPVALAARRAAALAWAALEDARPPRILGGVEREQAVPASLLDELRAFSNGDLEWWEAGMEVLIGCEQVVGEWRFPPPLGLAATTWAAWRRTLRPPGWSQNRDSPEAVRRARLLEATWLSADVFLKLWWRRVRSRYAIARPESSGVVWIAPFPGVDDRVTSPEAEMEVSPELPAVRRDESMELSSGRRLPRARLGTPGF